MNTSKYLPNFMAIYLTAFFSSLYLNLMRKFFYFILLATIIFYFITGCKKGFNPSLSTKDSTTNISYITASVSGRVIDMSNQPVGNANITTTFGSTTTDANGQFNLTNIKFDKNAAFVSVSKTGYFMGSTTFLTSSDNSKNYVEITLIPKVESGTFTASSGGNITIPTGGSISFQAGSIQDATTNMPYSGTVSVAAYFINPSNSIVAQIMPGDLRGIDSSNNEKGLQPYSMIVAELTGSSGQKLQLINNKPATLTFPIIAGLQSSAPATISLWSFDETKGLWKQEGIATKQGSNYTGKVAHFSYWDCDMGIPVVNFKMVVEDNNGNPLNGIEVDVSYQYSSSDTAFMTSKHGYTDGAGIVQGKVPANQQLQITVHGGQCNSALYTQTITTTNNDVDLGTAKVNVGWVPVIFSGTVKDCSGNNITNGTVTVSLDGNNTTSNITNGTFSITVNRCNANAAVANIVAVDAASNVQDATSIQNVTSANITNISLKPCTQTIEQYVNYTMNNTPYSFTFPTDSLTYSISTSTSWLSIWATKRTNRDEVDIYMADTIPGTSTGRRLYINQSNTIYQSKSTDAITTTITEFGPINGYIAGSFSGNLYTDTTGANATKYPVQGTFKFKRIY